MSRLSPQDSVAGGEPAPDVRSRRPVAIAVLLGVLAAAVYLLTLSSDHSVDTVIYAGNAEHAAATGDWTLRIFNPAHVLHTAVGALLSWLSLGLSIPVRAITWMQIWSAVSGGILAGLLFLWMHDRTRSVWIAAASAGSLAVSGGVWAFAVQGEPNLPALALGAAALFPVSRLLRDEEAPGSAVAIVTAGVLLGLAAALHLTLGTLWIGLLAAAPLAGRRRFLQTTGALSIASLVLAAAYLPRAVLLFGEPGAGPLDLVTFSGESPYPSYLGRSSFDPLGQLTATVSGFAPGSPTGLMQILVWPARMIPVAWGAAGIVGLVVALRRRDENGRLLVLALVWFAANVVLFAAWGDRNFEFLAFLLVPLSCAGTLGIASLPGIPTRSIDRVSGAAMGALGLAAACCVWAGTIRPGVDRAGNAALRAARMVSEVTAAGDHVVVAGGPDTRLKVYLPYFAARRIIVPDFFYGPSLSAEESGARFAARVRRACATGSVWVLGDIGAEHRIASFEGIPYEDVRRWLRTLAPEERARTEDGIVLRHLDGCSE